VLHRAQQTGRTVVLMCRPGPHADVKLCLFLDPSVARDYRQETESQEEQRRRFEVIAGDNLREERPCEQQRQCKKTGQAVSHADSVIDRTFRYRKLGAKPASHQKAGTTPPGCSQVTAGLGFCLVWRGGAPPLTGRGGA
jgi:hypothetical protein